VILSGSSRLLVQKGLTESLAGRFETIYLNHWTYPEMQEAFGWDVSTYAWFGGYPGSADLITDEDRWKKYVRDSLIETSISKDILMLTRIDKPALLKNLFEMGCMFSGQILSYSKIQGQLHDAGNTTTLSHYLDLLDTAGLLRGIEKFSGTAVRIRSSSPKFQVLNNALLSAQQTEKFDEIRMNPAKWGRIVESAIGVHLANYSFKENYKLYYWRDRKDEVDFVLQKHDKIIAIEVKSNFSDIKKGMNSFVQKYHPIRVYLIGDKGIPWDEFLRSNPNNMF